MTPSLSKSKFLAGCQCLKRLFWQVNPPEEDEGPDEATLAIFDQGHQVGALARQAFPGGVLVEVGSEAFADAVRRTKELLEDPAVPAIFEGAFVFENVKVRADIVVRQPRKRWQLIEVKQSTSVKDQHLIDVAVQQYVLQAAGVNLGGVSLMHLNSSYVYDGKQYDLNELFAIEEVRDRVKELLPGIPSLLEGQRAVLASRKPPNVKSGSHCSEPYPCEFFDLCNEPLPIDHVGNLPRLSASQSEKLEAMNIQAVGSIPADFKLSATQLRARTSIVEKRCVAETGLQVVLAALRYPLFFMDFETVFPAIPVHAGTRPYQQIPFQWSVHVQCSPKAQLEHHEYLAEDASDPREPFLTRILDVLETSDGHIVVYNQTFEETRLKELAERFPKYQRRIDQIRKRLWDLLPVVRNHVYHPEFCGSFSIKSVLPALVPEMSYSDLKVADGTQAGMAFLLMISAELSQTEKLQLRADLLKYCGQDTRAMHAILSQF